jgi:hypothetical protein
MVVGGNCTVHVDSRVAVQKLDLASQAVANVVTYLLRLSVVLELALAGSLLS